MSATLADVGLFQASYSIGGPGVGGVFFHVNLAVSTPAKSVSGIGHVFQSTNPPLNVITQLSGQYSYMCVMGKSPDNCHILVTATGVPVFKCQPGQALPNNVELRMALSHDWKSGFANYSYVGPDGKWHEVEQAPVTMIESKTVPANTK